MFNVLGTNPTPDAHYSGAHFTVAASLDCEADAYLIAAAPALKDALQAVLRYCVTLNGMPEKGKGRTDEQQAAYDQARAALALVEDAS